MIPSSLHTYRRAQVFRTLLPPLHRGINEFYDTVTPVKEKPQTGRAWRTSELRLKSFSDLHKLWFVLLKEKNVLLTQKAERRSTKAPIAWMNPYRMKKVRLSMARIKVVLSERKRVFETAQEKVKKIYAERKREKELQMKEERLREEISKRKDTTLVGENE
eukprot:TRINITY_DN4156_c0_g1_i7.p1 TRINITY_DN4156_c0_g1~~TRINITY_DN4156_c0_g1_i7.p1  ORF type:complete len:161 (-),score=37.14 TRINITY_DN4156_c0_g1_i7:140-622(-)